MKVAIVGYGSQGRSSYEYWLEGNEVTICDQNTDLQLPAGALSKLGDDYLEDLDSYDLIVRSPIVHPQDIVSVSSEAILQKVTTNTNEFLRVCPTKNIIGITGTKGKGTTSTLITRILESAGKRVHLGGNIGIPPINLLQQDIREDDWVVLELANFQLIDLAYSPHIGVCLMISNEHLNWHTNMDDYVQAKQQMFVHQKTDDIAIYYSENKYSQFIAGGSPGIKIPFMKEPGAIVHGDQIAIDGQVICQTHELQLLGKHNWQNVCAAITASWQVLQDRQIVRQAVIDFHGLPHRLEPVRTLGDVTYFNDSFASAPEATVAAVEAIPQQKVLIMGGFERGLDLSDQADGIVRNAETIRSILLIGASAERVANELQKRKFTNYEVLAEHDLAPIVARAKNLAQPGDAVILSPGFASFDMFKNFEERGEKFKAAVLAL